MDLIYIVLVVGAALILFMYVHGRKKAISQHNEIEESNSVKPELHDAESEHYP